MVVAVIVVLWAPPLWGNRGSVEWWLKRLNNGEGVFFGFSSFPDGTARLLPLSVLPVVSLHTVELFPFNKNVLFRLFLRKGNKLSWNERKWLKGAETGLLRGLGESEEREEG